MDRMYQLLFIDEKRNKDLVVNKGGGMQFTARLPYIPRVGETVVRHVTEEGHNEEHYCVTDVEYHLGRKRNGSPDVTINVDLLHTAFV